MEKDFVLIKLHARLRVWLIFRVLTSTHTALGLITSPAQSGVMVHTCVPNTLKGGGRAARNSKEPSVY